MFIKKPINFSFYHATALRIKFYSTNKIKTDKWKIILGREGITQFSHNIALEHIKSKKTVNYEIINKILAYCNICINEEILNGLINNPRIIINNLETEETKKFIIKNIGSPNSKIQIPGVYIFEHKEKKVKYVGSSSQLAIRLFKYLNYSLLPTGKFIPLLKADKLSSFTLEIVPLINNLNFRSEIVLEQYYLLDPSFNLNTIKVANNPSGSNAKPLYMYNRDKTILYYYSTQQKDFINNLNISHFTFTKHLNKGSYYLGKYLFSREPELNAKVKNISILKLALQLEKDRKLFNKNKPLNSLSRSVLMCVKNNLSLSNKVEGDCKEILFFSIGKCVEYLKNKGHTATHTTLVKYIETGKSYHGYIFKYV